LNNAGSYSGPIAIAPFSHFTPVGTIRRIASLPILPGRGCWKGPGLYRREAEAVEFLWCPWFWS